jgi:hypothetical protein
MGALAILVVLAVPLAFLWRPLAWVTVAVLVWQAL